ncbi:MAG: pyrimidine 5'-nucleotidase [Chloroflexota bacterium]
MRFSTLFFDLDDTLYPPESGLWAQIRQRINLFMYDRMGLPWDEIDELRECLFKEYGTTLRGLQTLYSLDMDEYLAYVHAVPLAGALHPDPALRAMLAGLPGRKFIFTNADTAHADRVLAAMQLEDIFEQTIDIKAIAPYCKPMPEAFSIATQIAGSPDPGSCLLIEDQARITRAARQLGWTTILAWRNGADPDADATLPRLIDLPELIETL